MTKDAIFAAEYGIIDEIRDVKIPPGASIIPLDSGGPQDQIAANNMGALHRILG